MFLKNHPKGLIPAALANMGERFGFYTMMAILTLFISSKFGFSESTTGIIFSVFYCSIYLLAFVGGVIADRTQKYKRTIMWGLIIMAFGYALIAIPTPTPVTNMPIYLGITCLGLFTIAMGNGLFKGNLQAVVGQMYDKPQYSKRRDAGFSIFYMFINIGGMLAPFAGMGVRNWWVGKHGFTYNAALPELCHLFLGNKMDGEALGRFTDTAAKASSTPVTDLHAFASDYLNVFTTGFHYAFAVAIIAMAISLVVFIIYKKSLPDPKSKKEATKVSAEEIKMSLQEIKQRIWALVAVMGVVIFFWFSFHQSGLTLTFFARDYTRLSIFGIEIAAEFFQSMNPFFVVFLTPVVLGVFGWMRARGKEPSTPNKIAIGMGIAAMAYLVMVIGSLGLPALSGVKAMGGLPEAMQITPWLLIGTYFILTVAELFISPLGISFVSKVAPPHLQGTMQAAWLGATAIGNSLLFIGAIFYQHLPLWMTWGLFVTVCLMSMTVMFGMLRWLNRITADKV